MKMRTIGLLTMLLAVAIAGCSQKQPELPTGQMIEVKLEVKPSEQLEPGQEATIQATISLEGKPVTEADEVEFEVYEAGLMDQSETIAGEHIGEGVYTIQKTFEKPSVYYVISHVTVGAMHHMPKQKIIVGSPENLEALEQQDNTMKHDPNSSMDEHNNHNH